MVDRLAASGTSVPKALRPGGVRVVPAHVRRRRSARPRHGGGSTHEADRRSRRDSRARAPPIARWTGPPHTAAVPPRAGNGGFTNTTTMPARPHDLAAASDGYPATWTDHGTASVECGPSPAHRDLGDAAGAVRFEMARSRVRNRRSRGGGRRNSERNEEKRADQDSEFHRHLQVSPAAGLARDSPPAR